VYETNCNETLDETHAALQATRSNFNPYITTTNSYSKVCDFYKKVSIGRDL